MEGGEGGGGGCRSGDVWGLEAATEGKRARIQGEETSQRSRDRDRVTHSMGGRSGHVIVPLRCRCLAMGERRRLIQLVRRHPR